MLPKRLPHPTLLLYFAMMALGLAAMAMWRPVSVTPDNWWQHWSTDPFLLLSLMFASGFYAYGIKQLWERVGIRRSIDFWQITCFYGGVVVLVIALLSPIDAIGEELFAVHMTQHVLLLTVAPPLLLIGKPQKVLFVGLPANWQRQFRVVSRLPHRSHNEVIVWVVHVSVIWLWHTPALYELALQYFMVHILEHLTFLGAGLLYWWSLLHPRRLQRHRAYGIGVLSLFLTALQGTILGMLITLSTSHWYQSYTDTTSVWGLTPLEDQQFAGIIMWLPVGLIYTCAAVILFIRWLVQMENNGLHVYEAQTADPIVEVD